MDSRFVLISAPAKINLYLGVHAQKDARGYHKVDSIMSAVDLCDTVAVAPSNRLVVATTPAADFPMEENTAYKAAVAMGKAFGREPNFTIVIDKHIPIRAGLGGPSTDAAAAILGICHYWGVDPNDKRIDEVARGIGADVPFFLYGPPAYFSGAGDKMERIFRPLTGTPVALVKPRHASVSTAEAYKLFDEDPIACDPIEPMVQALDAHNETEVFSHAFNNLAPIAEKLAPPVSEILAWLRTQDDVRAVDVCGSGACCYAICNTQMAAERIALAALNEKDWWAQAAKLAKEGPYIAVG